MLLSYRYAEHDIHRHDRRENQQERARKRSTKRVGGTLEPQVDRQGQLKFTRGLLDRSDRFARATRRSRD